LLYLLIVTNCDNNIYLSHPAGTGKKMTKEPSLCHLRDFSRKPLHTLIFITTILIL